MKNFFLIVTILIISSAGMATDSKDREGVQDIIESAHIKRVSSLDEELEVEEKQPHILYNLERRFEILLKIRNLDNSEGSSAEKVKAFLNDLEINEIVLRNNMEKVEACQIFDSPFVSQQLAGVASLLKARIPSVSSEELSQFKEMIISFKETPEDKDVDLRALDLPNLMHPNLSHTKIEDAATDSLVCAEGGPTSERDIQETKFVQTKDSANYIQMPVGSMEQVDFEALSKVASDLRFHILEEQSDLESAMKFFKILYEEPEIRKRVDGKRVFKLMTAVLPKDIYVPGEPLQYLEIYTYWYGQAGSKTPFSKFSQEEKQIIEELIEKIGGRQHKFVENNIDFSFDEHLKIKDDVKNKKQEEQRVRKIESTSDPRAMVTVTKERTESPKPSYTEGLREKSSK